MANNKTNDIKLYRKDYYENNKEKLNEIIMCECGEKYKKYKKSEHEKTRKHKTKMMEIEIKKLKSSDNTDICDDKKKILENIEKKKIEVLKSLESLNKLREKLESN